MVHWLNPPRVRGHSVSWSLSLTPAYMQYAFAPAMHLLPTDISGGSAHSFWISEPSSCPKPATTAPPRRRTPDAVRPSSLTLSSAYACIQYTVGDDSRRRRSLTRRGSIGALNSADRPAAERQLSSRQSMCRIRSIKGRGKNAFFLLFFFNFFFLLPYWVFLTVFGTITTIRLYHCYS